jgi:hypothetical protein
VLLQPEVTEEGLKKQILTKGTEENIFARRGDLVPFFRLSKKACLLK